MLGFPLGILSAAGAGGVVAGDYELISTTILGTATTSLTFSNLGDYASTYKHLQFRFVVRSSVGFEMDNMTLLFNGDTGNNYATHVLYGNGTSVLSEGFTTQPFMYLPSSIAAANSVANAFSGHVVDILDPYSTTKNTTMRALNGHFGGATFTSRRVGLSSAFWNNTASLTSVTLSSSANFVAGSRFSLYGVK